MELSTCLLNLLSQHKEINFKIFQRLCGHKDLGTKLDDRPFGFPFDRRIGFNINEKLK